MNNKKKILICGIDGYLGFSLSLYLTRRGYEIIGVDNLLRRTMVKEVGSDSLIPISNLAKFKKIGYHIFVGRKKNITDYDFITSLVETYQPDAIIHFAEQPSAPYSMIDANHANFTQQNNTRGTMNLLWAVKEYSPKTHIIKLGTMGEYGDKIYDKLKIPEQPEINVCYKNKNITIPTPRWASSFYHWSKVFDSFNLHFASKLWNLKVTDLNQGIVYGDKIDEMNKDYLRTRFDYDGIFGTVLNRFIVQAIKGLPLTVYGEGGQTRGYININDTMRCIELVINNSAKQGEFRVFNQLTEVISINDLAYMVKKFGDKQGLKVKIVHIKNPRQEKEKHCYKPVYLGLKKLGLKPRKMINIIPEMLKGIKPYKKFIKEDVILSKIKWQKD